MGFVRIFWKNNVQEGYLPKMSISGQIVSEMLASYNSENSIQTLLILGGGRPKEKKSFCGVIYTRQLHSNCTQWSLLVYDLLFKN